MNRLVYFLELEDGYRMFGQCWDTEWRKRLQDVEDTHQLIPHILGVITTDYSKECCAEIRKEFNEFIVAENIFRSPKFTEVFNIMAKYEGMERGVVYDPSKE